MVAIKLQPPSSFAPLSALPGISPTRGEISRFDASPSPAPFEIGESKGDGHLPLVWEMSVRTERGAAPPTSQNIIA